MKKTMLCLLLILCVMLLCACGEKETYPMAVSNPVTTQSLYSSEALVLDVPEEEEEETDWDSSDYDPGAEEGVWDASYDDGWTDTYETAAPTIHAERAGATPLVLDPIDKPTPTPLPALTFEYVTYEAEKLHLSFEAPSGWLVDDSDASAYILINPDNRTDFAASVTIRVTQLSSNYSKNDLKKEVIGMQSTVRSSVSFSKFDASNTAERSFLGTTGVYANYSGTLADDGVQIGGRMIAVCVNKNLYTVHVSFPLGYRDTYVDKVYDQIRHTIKITQ